MTFLLAIATLTVLSILAAWKENAIMFQITSGMAMIIGLNAPDIMTGSATTTSTDIAIGLSLTAYSFLCAGWSLRLMFHRERDESA